MKHLLLCSLLSLPVIFPGPAVQAQTGFTKHTVSTSAGQPMDVYTADINLDGRPDFVTGSNATGEVVWWENRGQGFDRHPVRSGLTGVRSVRAGDIDGDGDIDLIAASVTGNRIEWYENTGNQQFANRLLDGNFRGAHTVQLTDLDRDGKLDILCSGWDNTPAKSEIAWWKNLGNKQFDKQVVTADMDQAPFVEAADLDNDGDLDLIGADETPGEVYWWTNDGNQNFSQHLIDGNFNLAHTVVAKDLDKDGDTDILGAACTSGLLAWYENKGGGTFEKHPLPDLPGAIWLDCADFDLDGDLDMVGTGMGAGQLALFTNNGKQVFYKSWIEGAVTSGFALNLFDMDDDRDMDIVAIGYNSNFLGWWQNNVEPAQVMKAPGWLIRKPLSDNYLAVNMDKGNIVLTEGLDPVKGVANPVSCQAVCLTDNLLYAAAGPEIIAYDPETGIRKRAYRTDVQYLVGLTADDGGYLYASAPLDGKIIRLDTGDGAVTDLATGLSFPQALKLDQAGDKLVLLDGEELVAVKTIDPSTGETTLVKETRIQAGGDVEPDGQGNCYISSPGENTVYLMTGSGDVLAHSTGNDAPWGICLDRAAKELTVAMNTGNRLERIPASTAGANQNQPVEARFLRAFPNPFSDHITLSFNQLPSSRSVISLIDPSGRIILEKTIEPDRTGTHYNRVTLDLNGCTLTTEGLYLIKVTGNDGSRVFPVVRSDNRK